MSKRDCHIYIHKHENSSTHKYALELKSDADNVVEENIIPRHDKIIFTRVHYELHMGIMQGTTCKSDPVEMYLV